MGKNKASAKPVVTRVSTASQLPRPKLIGVQEPISKPTAPIEEATVERPSSAPSKHEPTLIGLPKHLPGALPPLKASKKMPQDRESSLVGLSRQVESTPRPQHKTGIRVKAPSPPPSAKSPSNKRHAAEPTDYNVEIIAAYAAPPLPARGSAAPQPLRSSAAPEAEDVAWDDDDVQLVSYGMSRKTIMGAAALGILCALAIGIWAFSTRTSDTKPLARALEKSVTEATPATAEAAPPALAAVPPPQAVAPLSAASIAAFPTPDDAPATLRPNSLKLTKKAAVRKRARAHRARSSHKRVSIGSR